MGKYFFFLYPLLHEAILTDSSLAPPPSLAEVIGKFKIMQVLHWGTDI